MIDDIGNAISAVVYELIGCKIYRYNIINFHFIWQKYLNITKLPNIFAEK